MSSGDFFTPSFIIYLNNSRLPPEREAEIRVEEIVTEIASSASLIADVEKIGYKHQFFL